MPAKVIEQHIELFGNPKENFALHGNHFCPLVFESWNRKFGGVVRHYYTIKIEVHPFFSYFFRASVGVKFGEKYRAVYGSGQTRGPGRVGSSRVS